VVRRHPDNGDGPLRCSSPPPAILDYNGGQGGLALEEIANIGGTVLNLELMTEAEVAERNIRETVVELLDELAERRQGGGAAGNQRDSDLGQPALPGDRVSRGADISTADDRAPRRSSNDFIHDGEGGFSEELAGLLRGRERLAEAASTASRQALCAPCALSRPR
jgi:hypothetical protein